VCFQKEAAMSHITNPAPNLSDFDVPILSRFIRVNFGANAQNEATRHITQYVQENRRDLAEIWVRILEEIQKSEGEVAASKSR
jgi:hypothetical protein